MDERAALELVGDAVASAGDDAAIVGDCVATTDMLHESTDFPDGTTRYTAGWRAVGASLSDVAAMGAGDPVALAVYAAPAFERAPLEAFLDGATDVCEFVDGEYVGGDLDTHAEFTVATTAIGDANGPGAPVRRTGATPGDAVCVTGSLGRSAAALELFERGDAARANERFRFEPRIAPGRALAPHASAMMDSSDGLARSLHQLAAASGCGFAVSADEIPVDDVLRELSGDPDASIDRAISFGEDFELVCTVPRSALDDAREDSPVPLTEIGTVTADRVELDGERLADRGYTHGDPDA